MRGNRMDGSAREFVQQMLPMYINDEELGKVGIHRETRSFAQIGSKRFVQETRFYRPHHEMDVTSYGDTYKQLVVTSPGLDETVTGEKEDIDLFALLLIHQGIHMQLASEERSNAEKAKAIARQHGEIKERDSALLAMWGKLGKKRRANLRASDPKVADLCERLEEEAENERRMDAMEFDY